MILQALKEYYDRKAADPEARMAPVGWEWKEIPFIIVLSESGKFHSIYEARQPKGRRWKVDEFLVPQDIGRTSGMKANLLWDKASYSLGVREGEDIRVLSDQKACFTKRVQSLLDVGCSDIALIALKKFLSVADYDFVGVETTPWKNAWQEIRQNDPFIAFRLLGDDARTLICNRKEVSSFVVPDTNNSDDEEDIDTKPKTGRCLVTGELGPITTKHQKTPILGSKSNAKIVSFNLDAFNSYKKKRGANAPVSTTAAFAYTTALKHLLRKDSLQKLHIGDATTIFWSEKKLTSEFEDFFGDLWRDDPDKNTEAVKSLFRSPQTGAFVTDSDATKFYILGLAPNSSRITIRFWIVNTVDRMASVIRKHFGDTEIAPPQWESVSSKRLPLNALLASTANETKYDKAKTNLVFYRGKYYDAKPNLTGDTMRAILEGLPYPQTLLQAAIRRIRAEQGKKDKNTGKSLPNITYPRAALIKACLNRSIRYKNPNIKEELKVSLDPNNTNIGYRLGRLFATLEKIQQEANPGINATIRDRFYGAASSTPVTVFGNLMRLKNHHIAKLEHQGRKRFFEKLLGAIIDGVDAKISFPPHLPLENQGRFAIGYYHQMQDFFA